MTNIMNLVAIVLTLAALVAAVAAVGGTLRVYAQRYTGGLVTALAILVVTLPCAAGSGVRLRCPRLRGCWDEGGLGILHGSRGDGS